MKTNIKTWKLHNETTGKSLIVLTKENGDADALMELFKDINGIGIMAVDQSSTEDLKQLGEIYAVIANQEDAKQ